MACKRLAKGKLDAVMAVKAFDAEIATISHSVKTPETAAIRYEFWGSALKRIKRKESGKTVMLSLSHIISRWASGNGRFIQCKLVIDAIILARGKFESTR